MGKSRVEGGQMVGGGREVREMEGAYLILSNRTVLFLASMNIPLEVQISTVPFVQRTYVRT